MLNSKLKNFIKLSQPNDIIILCYWIQHTLKIGASCDPKETTLFEFLMSTTTIYPFAKPAITSRSGFISQVNTGC